MVEYAYHELFNQSNVPKDMLIVDADTNVTSVSGSAPQISNNTYIFTTEEIETESFELDESLCSEDNLTFGLCEAAKVNVNVIEKGYDNLKDVMFAIYIYFNGDSDTLFQVGVYRIFADTHSDDRRFRELEMYDLLYYLRDYDITPWYYNYFSDGLDHTLEDAVEMLFDWLNQDEGIPIGFAEETLPNRNFPITQTIQSDAITFEFFMQRILEINGCFGHIKRNGDYEFKWLKTYDTPAVKDIVDDIRVPEMPYEDNFVWSIGLIEAYNSDNLKLYTAGSSSKKYPSIYSIVDSFLFANMDADNEELAKALDRMWKRVKNLIYRPVEVTTIGDLCIEVGDRLEVQYKTENGEPVYFHTYALERHFTGIQSFRDTYTAKGDRKQPRYSPNENWHYGDGTIATEGAGTGGVSDVSDNYNNFCEIIRNIGYRLLDEPSNVEVVYNKADGQVEISWVDPSDLSNNRPIPLTWLGTVVVRKEGSAPLHRWDGELIVNSTTRDEYSVNPLIDNTIEDNKRYYYGIFPYHRYLSDADNNINHYRFTKVVSVNTGLRLVAAEITGFGVEGTSVSVLFTIPTLDVGTYSSIKLVGKKGSIPESELDGDITETLASTDTSKLITELDELSTYYFVIYSEDSIGNKAESEAEFCRTGRNEGYNFAYTGSIQTFTAPRTGIYQLETWGAQGGNASDDNLVARGGYGAYAVGEVLLTQGETLYIGVGGQNGFNGGGSNKGIHNLEHWQYRDETVDMSILTDFTKIPDGVKTATSPTYSRIWNQGISSVPSWLSLGDILYQYSLKDGPDDGKTCVFVDSDYIKIVFGAYPYGSSTYYGLAIYNKITGDLITYYGDFYTGANELRTYYLSIVIDAPNQRAYLLLANSKTGVNYFRVDAHSFMYNGIDLLWETFSIY